MRLVFILFAAVLFMTACSPKKLQNNLIYAQNDNTITVSTLKSNTERAHMIKKTILTVDGITSAAVVVTGKTALIGIKTESGDMEEIKRLKTLAQDIAFITDPDIKNVAITSDDEIYKRIETMETDL